MERYIKVKTMKVIEPKVEIWEQPKGIEGIYKQIERAGRVCYKSEDHTTEDSAKPFVERMIASKHYAMLEHGTVYLNVPLDDKRNGVLILRAILTLNKYTKSVYGKSSAFFATNMRVLVEHGIWDIANYFISDFSFHEEDIAPLRRVTVHFTTQIAVSREANRHRVNSMAEQSTRYCNYSKDKFDGSLTISVPEWIGSSKHYEDYRLDRDMFMEFADAVYDGTATSVENWVFANVVAERAYMNLIKNGRKPQEARVILPLDTNTELVHTAFVSDWLHFFDLRALNKTGKAHPDMVAVAKPLYEEFKKRGYIK